jgi:hypothetical protein
MQARVISQPRLVAASTLLGAALIGAASSASADTIRLEGTATLTEISGFAGTAYRLGMLEGERGVYGLWSMERSDEPCFVGSLTENVNDAGDDSGATRDLCGNNPTSSEMKVEFSDPGFADRTFVRAVRVCMNNDNTKVKGFQIRGRTINADGSLTDLPSRYPDSANSSGMTPLSDLNAPSDERNHCNGNWKRWVECPSGRIASAVSAHFSAGSTPRSLTGLALYCRSVGNDG